MKFLKDCFEAIFISLVFCAIALVARDALAQAASVPVDLTGSEALSELLNSVGGLKGATALGIVTFVVQAAMLVFRVPALALWAGKWRLLVVTLLSLVAGVLALRASGVDWVGCFVHSATLASLQVFANQFIRQFKNDPAQEETPVLPDVK